MCTRQEERITSNSGTSGWHSSQLSDETSHQSHTTSIEPQDKTEQQHIWTVSSVRTYDVPQTYEILKFIQNPTIQWHRGSFLGGKAVGSYNRSFSSLSDVCGTFCCSVYIDNAVSRFGFQARVQCIQLIKFYVFIVAYYLLSEVVL
jgi:hypothetical protein